MNDIDKLKCILNDVEKILSNKRDLSSISLKTLISNYNDCAKSIDKPKELPIITAFNDDSDFNHEQYISDNDVEKLYTIKFRIKGYLNSTNNNTSVINETLRGILKEADKLEQERPKNCIGILKAIISEYNRIADEINNPHTLQKITPFSPKDDFKKNNLYLSETGIRKLQKIEKNIKQYIKHKAIEREKPRYIPLAAPIILKTAIHPTLDNSPSDTIKKDDWKIPKAEEMLEKTELLDKKVGLSFDEISELIDNYNTINDEKILSHIKKPEDKYCSYTVLKAKLDQISTNLKAFIKQSTKKTATEEIEDRTNITPHELENDADENIFSHPIIDTQNKFQITNLIKKLWAWIKKHAILSSIALIITIASGSCGILSYLHIDLFPKENIAETDNLTKDRSNSNSQPPQNNTTIEGNNNTVFNFNLNGSNNPQVLGIIASSNNATMNHDTANVIISSSSSIQKEQKSSSSMTIKKIKLSLDERYTVCSLYKDAVAISTSDSEAKGLLISLVSDYDDFAQRNGLKTFNNDPDDYGLSVFLNETGIAVLSSIKRALDNIKKSNKIKCK